MNRRSRYWLALSLCPLVSGCGSGTFGIFAGSDSSSSSSNADTVGSDLGITSSTGDARPAESPACVSFLLTDQEGDSADCEITFDDGSGPRPITLAAGSETLSQVASGGTHTVLWNFAADLGGEGYVSNLQLHLEVLGGISPAELNGVAVGNDPPEILGAEALPAGAGEYDGNVDVGFTVRDTAGDVVNIRVEYNDDAAWKLARPAATPLADATPAYAITGFATDSTGVSGTFRWDTEFDLAGFDDEVLVRFTAEDAFEPGLALASGVFRIDNNRVPVVFLQEGALVANPDERGAITIPFTLFDEESDDVHVVLQWRENGEPFPALPSDPATIARILSDPIEREAHRIVEELPFSAGGRVVPVDATSVRLPELAGPSSLVLHARAEIVGDELTILRSGRVPQPLDLPDGLLAGPVAALPVGDGTSALVLDRDGSFAWRLREIGLGSGRVLRTIASGAQAFPSTMVLERGGAAVLVAEDLAGTWRIQRVELESGSAQELEGVGGTGRVHGMASLGSRALFVTAGDSLGRIDYDTDGTSAATLLHPGLAEPRGIALDPLDPGRLYVAEHAAGRVVVLELGTHQRSVVAVKELGDPGGFPRPSELAVERNGSRLLVVTDPVPFDFLVELRGVDLGGPERAEVFDLIPSLPEGPVGLACGPEGLRLLAVSALDDLRAAGGIEQVRRITGYDPGRQVATVDAPFDPALVASREWRWSKATPEPFKTAPQGAAGFLVWDSAEIRGGGEVDLRLTAFDSDPGNAQVSAVAKVVRDPLEVEPILLGGLVGPQSFASGDLNGDGLLDVVAPDSGSLAVFHQSSPGVFPSSPDLALDLGGMDTTPFPRSPVVADLNDDGRLDIASANLSIQLPNESESSLTVFYQGETGFSSEPSLTLGVGALFIPQSLTAADLNGDGRLDLVCSNQVGASEAERGLMVFFQTPEGGFPTAPDVTLDYPAADFKPGALAAAHLDDDGRLDLAVADSDFGFPRLIVFYASGSTQTLGTQVRPVSLVAADVNDDGRMDLVSLNSASITASLTVFFQREDGRFPQSPGVTLQDPSLLRIPAGLGAADMNGDGRIDLFTGERTYDSLIVFFQTEAGEFSTEDVLVLEGTDTLSDVFAVEAADWNGDGLLDLGASTPGQLELFLRAGPPGPLRTSPSQVVSWEDAYVATTGDLNADGLPDLVATRLALPEAGPHRGELSVFFQSGAGQFPASPNLTLGSFTGNPRSVATADLNGDGRVDLATANTATGELPGNNLTVFFQTPNGGFPEAPDLTLGGPSTTINPLAVTAADLNADGRIDLALANFGFQNDGDSLTLFFQTEDEEEPFRATPSRTLIGSDAPGGYFTLDSCDLNGDGKADLVAGTNTATLNVFFQFGLGGSYSQEPDWTSNTLSPGNLRHVSCADLNADGLPDLAAAYGEGVAVFFQSKSAPGVFPSMPNITLENPPATDFARHLSPGDLNADGLVDLMVAAGTSTSGVTVFLQTSPGRFAQDASYFLPGGGGQLPLSIVTSDLNNDGQLDLLSAGGGRLNVYLSE